MKSAILLRILVLRLVSAMPFISSTRDQLLATFVKPRKDIPELWSPEFWEKLTMSAVLVLLGGVFAGLTLGLMGLDELHLRVLAASSDDPKEKKNAKAGLCSISSIHISNNIMIVLRLMRRGRHWVLVVGSHLSNYLTGTDSNQGSPARQCGQSPFFPLLRVLISKCR